VNQDTIRILRKLVEVQVILIFSLVLFGRTLARFAHSLFDSTTLEYTIGATLCLSLIAFSFLGDLKGVIRWVRLLICLLLILATATMLVSAEEALHLLLYSLLCITTLKLNEAEDHPSSASRAFIFTIFVGFIDEGLQALHPQRFFDPRDLALNALGAVIGLIGTFSTLKSHNSTLKKPPT